MANVRGLLASSVAVALLHCGTSSEGTVVPAPAATLPDGGSGSSSGAEGGGGANDASDASDPRARADAAPDGSAVGGCPKAPPLDTTAPGMASCLEPVLVGVGDRSRRVVSFDGTTWLYDQIDSGNVVDGQALDDSAFVAAFGLGYIVTASDFGIFTSADRGQTWTKAPAPAPQQWGQGVHVSPVVFNGAAFVVFSDTDSFTSQDALNWTRHTLARLAGDHMAFHGYAVGAKGRIVASGGQAALNVTDDGVTWRSVDTAIAGGFTSIAYGNGAFVGVGNGARASSDDNGESWTVVRDDCGAGDATRCVGTVPSQVLFRQGTFVFTTSGNPNTVVQSANGKDWSAIGAGFGYDWSHAFFAGMDFAVHGGSQYWSGPGAGGPWASHAWTTNADHPVQTFHAGLVLKR
jgi:hypothetical protein